MMQLPNTIDRQRSSGLRQQPRWKRPTLWFRFVIAAFSLNLFIAIVTVEHHLRFSTTSEASKTLKSDFTEIDLPRTSPWKMSQGKTKFSTGKKNDLYCSNAKNKTTASDGTSLTPLFGFFETVRACVRENEPSKKELSSPMYCHAPLSGPSCQSLQYTVIIYSNGYASSNGDEVDKDYFSNYFGNHTANRYWRNVVVWTMQFLEFSSVQRVNLILREPKETHNKTSATVPTRRTTTTLENSAKRNKYAKRILNWSRNGVVNVVPTSFLRDAIDGLEVPSAESVLWINGDYPVGLQSHVANGTALCCLN